MQITIRWQKPIQLTRGKKIIIDPKDIPNSIENVPGVYFFARTFGKSIILPFYVGETLTIRTRLKSHLESTKIADVLRGISDEEAIKNGTKYFHYGYLHGNAERKLTKRRLSIVQKHLIRLAIETGAPILNYQLTTMKTHSLEFIGSASARAIYAKSSAVEAK